MDILDWRCDADPTVPNAARAYNYAIGEFHNFHADRQFAEDVHQASGRTFLAEAQANRAFVLGTVRTLSRDAGIRQFFDIGCGSPTRTNAHDVAPTPTSSTSTSTPSWSVTAAICGPTTHASASSIHGDVRQPEQILRHPDVTARLDLTQPIGVLLGAVLDFVPDPDDCAGVLTQLAAAAAPGSYLALSHGLVTSRNIAQQDRVRRLFGQTATPLYPRTTAQLHTMLDGWSGGRGDGGRRVVGGDRARPEPDHPLAPRTAASRPVRPGRCHRHRRPQSAMLLPSARRPRAKAAAPCDPKPQTDDPTPSVHRRQHPAAAPPPPAHRRHGTDPDCGPPVSGQLALSGTLCALLHADGRGSQVYLPAVGGPVLINNFLLEPAQHRHLQALGGRPLPNRTMPVAVTAWPAAAAAGTCHEIAAPTRASPPSRPNETGELIRRWTRTSSGTGVGCGPVGRASPMRACSAGSAGWTRCVAGHRRRPAAAGRRRDAPSGARRRRGSRCGVAGRRG